MHIYNHGNWKLGNGEITLLSGLGQNIDVVPSAKKGVSF